MSLLDVLYPRFCLGCGKFGTYCCSACIASAPILQSLKCIACGKPTVHGRTHPECCSRWGLDGLVSFFRYGGLIKQVIHKIKYRFAYTIVPALFVHIPQGHIMRVINGMGGTPNQCVLIPVPLHPARLRRRGFNQAGHIAKALQQATGIPTCENVLYRVRNTPAQVTMRRRSDRLENVNNVFRVKALNGFPKNTLCILVDDVMTTGATLQNAAKALKQSGFKSVWAITLAQ